MKLDDLGIPHKLPYTLEEIGEVLTRLASEEHIDFIAVFGSYSHGTQKESSDLDLIIDCKDHFEGSGIGEGADLLQLKLIDLLGMKVDVYTQSALLNSYIPFVWHSRDYTIVYGRPIIDGEQRMIDDIGFVDYRDIYKKVYGIAITEEMCHD